MARGFTYKRCPHGITGTPSRGARPATPACKVRHGSWAWRSEGPKDQLTGKRSQPSKGGYASRDDAERALNAYLAELDAGRGVHDRQLTVEQWLRRWLADGPTGRTWQLATADRYARHVETLIPLVGKYRLHELRKHHVDQMLHRLAEPVVLERTGPGSRFTGVRKPSSLDMIRRTLRSALADAAERGLVATNAAAGKFAVLEHEEEEDDELDDEACWQADDLAAFLEHVVGDELESLWITAAFTGLRRGELCGLRWSAVDLDGETPGLYVNQRVVALSGPRPCTACGGEHRGRIIRPGAKTRRGRRWVPLVPPAVDALRVQKDKIDAVVASFPDVFVDHGLVWPYDDGAPLRPTWLTQRHAELVAASGRPKVVLHGMRHGAVSLLAAAGMPQALISLIIGHAENGRVTQGVYTHAMKAPITDYAKAIVELVDVHRKAAREQNVHSYAVESGSEAV